MTIKCSFDNAVDVKRAQSGAMALREIDDSIAYITRAGGIWINDEDTVKAIDRTVRVNRVYRTENAEIMIDVVDGSKNVFGLRPLHKDGDGAGFVVVEIVQYQPRGNQ